jgi:hypothetical protein
MIQETLTVSTTLFLKLQKDQQTLILIKRLIKSKDFDNQEDLVYKIKNIIEKSSKMDEKLDSLS